MRHHAADQHSAMLRGIDKPPEMTCQARALERCAEGAADAILGVGLTAAHPVASWRGTDPAAIAARSVTTGPVVRARDVSLTAGWRRQRRGTPAGNRSL